MAKQHIYLVVEFDENVVTTDYLADHVLEVDGVYTVDVSLP